MLAARPLLVILAAGLALLQAGCAGVAPAGPNANPSPCAVGEASMACQVERYNNVNAD